MRISDWSSDVCSSDLIRDLLFETIAHRFERGPEQRGVRARDLLATDMNRYAVEGPAARDDPIRHAQAGQLAERLATGGRLRLGEGIEAALRAGDHARRPQIGRAHV